MSFKESFYHMSPALHEVDEIFTLRIKSTDYLGDQIGSILERNRPDFSISRLEAIFLNDSDDFSTHGILQNGYIYRVQAIGEIQTHNNYWLGVLQKRYSHKHLHKVIASAEHADLEDDEIARNYWNGTEASEGRQEFLAKSLKIIKRLTEKPVSPSYNSPLNKDLREIRN